MTAKKFRGYGCPDLFLPAYKARTLYGFVFLLLLVVFSPSAAGGQIAGTGSIQGTVSDPTGAVIPNAPVNITNDATQVEHTATTGRNGLYTFPNIDIGTYTLVVSSPGFEGYRQQGIVLEVGSSIGMNIKMAVGRSDQQIEVQSSGLALQTEDSSFKQTIDERTLTELPLNGRQVTSLITLSGASVPDTSQTQGNKGFFSSVSPEIAGGQGNQTDYRLDGGDNNDWMTNTSFAFPFPDAVNQFSVETTALGAQSGLHPAGLVNVVTRSGTNQWHGAAFEFIRNNIIDATNFFSTSKDSLHQNQFGGTFGGKIIRDKLFFFAGYQRLDSSSSSGAPQVSVPTPANLLGDFSVTDSAACVTSGVAIQLLNPITGAILPGDQISPSYFNASSLALQKYLPATSSPCGFVTFAIPTFQTENQFITRIDSTLTKKHSLYGRYFLDGYVTPALFSPSNILLTNNPGNTEREQTLTIGETWVARSNLVNSLHLTATRRTNIRGAAANGINGSNIGINAYQPYAIGLRVSAGKFTTYCSTCATGAFNVNAFSVADDVTLLLGKHQLLFGGSYVRAELNLNNAYESNGTFTFSGIFSQKGPAGTSTGGTGQDANLDFLTGSMTQFQQSTSQQNATRAPVSSLYIQDTFHATQRLVLLAGLNWTAEFVPVDYFHRGSQFNMTAFLANQHSTVFPNAPAGSFYYGDTGVTNNFTKNSLWQFSPRLGVTFDPIGNGKTVFRAGASLVYDEANFFLTETVNQNPPFAPQITNSATTAPISFSNPWVGGTTPGNPFPLPFHPPSTTAFSNQSSYEFLMPQTRSPYVMQWTASMEHELPHGWEFQLDYIGNKTTHAYFKYPLNPAVYIPGNYTGPGSCGPLLVSPGIGKPCSSTGNQASRFLLTLDNTTQGPFYQGGGSGTYLNAQWANASYNALVTSIQHRLSANFSFLANYTWSHCIDINTTVENPNNLRLDRASCSFDYRSMFNSTMVASSHFPVSGIAGAIVNNWEIAPLIRITSGQPFNVTSGIDNSLTDIGNDRPNLVNPSAVYTKRKPTAANVNSSSVYLNASAFTQNAIGTYGNVGAFSFIGPKFLQLDSALSRTFPLHERLNLIFRLEAFNVLNHPNFGNPTAALNSSTFGKITTTVGSGARVFQGALKVTF